jgi:AraC-like DNA-binding protein
VTYPTSLGEDTPAARPVYVRILLQLAAQEGLQVSRLLAASGLRASQLEDNGPQLSLRQVRPLLRSVLDGVGRPEFAIEAGLATPVSGHGALGRALQHSPTLRRAVGLLSVHFGQRTRMVVVRCVAEPGGLAFCIEPAMDLGDVQRYILDRITATCSRLWRDLSGGPPQWRLDLPWPRPERESWLLAWQGLAEDVRFGAPRLAFHLSDTLLDRPLPAADAHAWQQAHAALLDETPTGVPRSDVVSMLRTWLEHEPPGVHCAGEAAEQFGVSTRTLHRWLAEAGTSFQALQIRPRQERLLTLLADPNVSMAEVAMHLGLHGPQNLSRCCRLWFNAAPTELRRQLMAGDLRAPIQCADP